VPVQFIPVYNDLVKNAVFNSRKVNYGRLKTNVVGLEYLIAIMLQTYRAKDRKGWLRSWKRRSLIRNA